jgi:K+-sensing histidine kinase KdpD
LQRIFNQDRSYLALFQEDGTLEPLFSNSSSEKTPVSQSIINRVFQNAESFLLEDALDDVALKTKESIIALRIRSALCVPLLYRNQIYGLIYLDRNIPGTYKQTDLELLRSISFMLAPLIENARLWSELTNHYTKTVETLKETEARLISAERTAAFVRLAQAMAHEIRNPLMAMGGLVKMMGRSVTEGSDSKRFNEVLGLVERVEQVLKEVDSFVKLPLPEKKLERIDLLIQKVIESDTWKVTSEVPRPLLSFNTSHLMVPLDADLFKKALSAMFKEIVLSAPRGSDFKISVHDRGDEVEIVIGEDYENKRLYELFDPKLQNKLWSLGLFLNMAQKIISDHGGKLLVDPEGHSIMPLFIRIPRRAKTFERGHEAGDL